MTDDIGNLPGVPSPHSAFFSQEKARELFDRALYRADEHAKTKMGEFRRLWEQYINNHPWDEDVVPDASRTQFEVFILPRENPSTGLSLAFGEWAQALRAALDNAVYAYAVAVTGEYPPEGAEQLQFPIFEGPEKYAKSRWRYRTIPDFFEATEKVQPYQSPWGPTSNLLYWINELGRTDRHREPHIGLGRVEKHKIGVYFPHGITAKIDTDVEPYGSIEEPRLIGRFWTDKPVPLGELNVDFTGVEVGPEVKNWSTFQMDGKGPGSLHDRMMHAMIYTRHHIESIALLADITPSGGFQTFDPDDPDE